MKADRFELVLSFFPVSVILGQELWKWEIISVGFCFHCHLWILFCNEYLQELWYVLKINKFLPIPFFLNYPCLPIKISLFCVCMIHSYLCICYVDSDSFTLLLVQPSDPRLLLIHLPVLCMFDQELIPLSSMGFMTQSYPFDTTLWQILSWSAELCCRAWKAVQWHPTVCC